MTVSERVASLEEALLEAKKDYEYLIEMIAANDPMKIDNGTQYRQNGIVADVIATAAQGLARTRKALENA